jgi:hypothetical protein
MYTVNHSPAERTAAWARAINLLVPGTGMILIGSTVTGLLAGLLFAACANLAIVAVFLFPDDFSGTTQALAIGLAAGTYCGVQVRLAGQIRAQRAAAAASFRRQVLWQSQELLAQGQAAGAVEALQPLAAKAGSDLLVAYRLAQALTAAEDRPAARAAWQQVRALDRHGLYKQQLRENADTLGGL